MKQQQEEHDDQSSETAMGMDLLVANPKISVSVQTKIERTSPCLTIKQQEQLHTEERQEDPEAQERNGHMIDESKESCDNHVKPWAIVRRRMQSIRRVLCHGPLGTSAQEVSHISEDKREEEEGQNEEEEDEEEDDCCVICLEHERSHAFVPCGHRIICANCAWNPDFLLSSRKLKCPFCRSPSSCIIKIQN